VLLLVVATASAIVLMLLFRPGDPKHDALRAARASVAPAAASSAASGVGGKADVMLLPSPAMSPASAPR
jgi:hypothetical protein